MIGTKWPRLLVAGASVTEEQADLILIRTARLMPFTNDKTWQRTMNKIFAEFGAPLEPAYDAPRAEISAWYPAFRTWTESIGSLHLNYLHNSQLASAWLGGPHGWCDWAGRIGCDTFNIGKWPTTEEVTEDWTIIAAAFPFLTLASQLVEDEGEGEVCGSWAVSDGVCTYDDTVTKKIQPVRDLSETEILSVFTNGSYRERGVDADRLRRALSRCLASE